LCGVIDIGPGRLVGRYVDCQVGQDLGSRLPQSSTSFRLISRSARVRLSCDETVGGCQSQHGQASSRAPDRHLKGDRGVANRTGRDSMISELTRREKQRRGTYSRIRRHLRGFTACFACHKKSVGYLLSLPPQLREVTLVPSLSRKLSPQRKTFILFDLRLTARWAYAYPIGGHWRCGAQKLILSVLYGKRYLGCYIWRSLAEYWFWLAKLTSRTAN